MEVVERRENALFSRGRWILGQVFNSKNFFAFGLIPDSGSPEDHSPQKGLWISLVSLWTIPFREAPPTEAVNIPWRQQVPPREPCHLVELLDQGWFEKNVLANRRRRLPPPPAVKVEEVQGLLQRNSSNNKTSNNGNGSLCNGGYNGDRRMRASSPEEIVCDAENTSFRGRQRCGTRSHGRRSSSVDAVRLARLREEGGDDGWAAADVAIGRSASTGGTQAQFRPQLRCRSLTDMDMEELQGFMDLGYIFPLEETSPQIAAALPALTLYHAVECVQNRLLSNKMPPGGKHPHHQQPYFGSSSPLGSVAEGRARPLETSPSEPWMLPTLDDHPANVKMHLRVWARTVASTVRQAC